ncbi:MAG: YebC/PmpR family DNA-binding transcriptional regulator, partial [Chloroflexota bacterium]
GSGQGGEDNALEEVLYEGYGPHGIAILVQVLTDNRMRTVAEVRHLFTRYGGNLSAANSVAWMFARKGYLAVNPGDADPDEIGLLAIEAGAEDVETSASLVELYTAVEDFAAVREALAGAKYELSSAQLSWIPQSPTGLGEEAALKAMKLIELLEDLDDVQEVYSNLDIQDELIAKYEAAA